MAASTDLPDTAITQVSVPDGTTYYLCQSDETLTEVQYPEGGRPVEVEVGTAQPDTNATYLVNCDSERSVYCLNADSCLQEFKFDDDGYEWQQGDLDGLHIQAASNTHLAALSTDDGVDIVFFQQPNGQLSAITRENGQPWQQSSTIPRLSPMDGASLFALHSSEGSLLLFYSHKSLESYSIHKLQWNGTTWTGNVAPSLLVSRLWLVLTTNRCAADVEVPQTDGYLRKSHIVAQGRGDDIVIQFCDEDARVYLLKDGELSRLGIVFQGQLKKEKDAQADRWPEELQSTIKMKGLK
ncbi:hypothetical protein AbraIFM66950_006618 [Aspergillus brasiliensis]|nr:hypothetical protein AbraIFM66950_006618 [Aspergillus brasiliensis]